MSFLTLLDKRCQENRREKIGHSMEDKKDEKMRGKRNFRKVGLLDKGDNILKS